jgi:hypothetical protein
LGPALDVLEPKERLGGNGEPIYEFLEPDSSINDEEEDSFSSINESDEHDDLANYSDLDCGGKQPRTSALKSKIMQTHS